MGRQRGASAVERWEYKSAVDMAKAIKPLSRPLSEQPATLTTEERALLAQCTAAVDTLQYAFWAAGKALETIREGRLYRAECSTFDDFVWRRWNMKKAYANKLVRTWRIAEAVFEMLSNGLAPIGAKNEKALRNLNQAQVWELVPVAEAWGTDAAALVYRSALGVDAVKLSAKVLEGAVAELALDGEFDAEETAKRVRVYVESLAEEQEETGEAIDFSARAEKAVAYNWVRRLARKDTAAAAQYLDELERHIAKCRAELLPQQQAAELPQGQEA
ncbi:hypothetical protein [Streptomyces mangrovi]|uniref:hypothetical protein n=1 Tax=Streptomyces mangrovi TaxID=1206892 RepID=UPI00399CAFA6